MSKKWSKIQIQDPIPDAKIIPAAPLKYENQADTPEAALVSGLYR